MERTERNKYRFSGHESFPCRYAWLPKAVKEVERDETILSSAHEEDAMVALGVGKNMVRAIRFWAESADVIESMPNGHRVTQFGRELLLGENAKDAYLEDIKTLWLIHWKLTSNQRAPIFAWDYLLNKYHEPELYASAVVSAFSKAAPLFSDKEASQGAMEQLYDVFIHSYVSSRSRKGEIGEDNLDCPLVELELLRTTGSTQSSLHPGRWEPKYAFRYEEKPEISAMLFAYCLEDFWSWKLRAAAEQTISFQSIVVGQGSPGQVFKIPEWDIRSRLYSIEKVTNGHFVFEESATIPRVVRTQNNVPNLDSVYQLEGSYA